MNKQRSLLHSALLCTMLGLSPLACDFGKSQDDKDERSEGQQGTLVVKLTDAPLDDVDSVFVTFSELAVHRCTPKSEDDEGEDDKKKERVVAAKKVPSEKPAPLPEDIDVLDPTLGEMLGETDPSAKLKEELMRLEQEVERLESLRKEAEEDGDEQKVKDINVDIEKLGNMMASLYEELDRIEKDSMLPGLDDGDQEQPEDEKPVDDDQEQPEDEKPQGDEPVDDDKDEIEEPKSECEKGSWEVIKLGEQVKFDLLTLQDGKTADFGEAKLPVGRYGQFRLKIDAVTLVSGGEEIEVDVPSGASSGLKFKGSFDIEADKALELTIDFDAGKSLSFTEGRGWKLRPVIKLLK